MKKVLFFIFSIISIVLLINIITIIANDLDKLTSYGYGYLVGKIILFLIFVIAAFVTRKRVAKS